MNDLFGPETKLIYTERPAHAATHVADFSGPRADPWRAILDAHPGRRPFAEVSIYRDGLTVVVRIPGVGSARWEHPIGAANVGELVAIGLESCRGRLV